MNWFIAVVKKYADFSGRAHRTEYWMFVLFYIIFNIVLFAIELILGLADVLTGLFLFGLALLIPSLAVAVRRMHDTGQSGWWVLITLIPIIGIIAFIVFAVQDSEPGSNSYGPNPKG